jgi:outer membrane receptor for ferric coprogen and ferric-rhodotorulic acid
VSQSFVPQFPGVVDTSGNRLDPETGLQYEFGAKSELLGNRLLTTLALYHIEKSFPRILSPKA